MDLNADLGEGSEHTESDSALLGLVTSTSLACGGHAGTPTVMASAVAAAKMRSVTIGAHPSYPDRSGFGRRHLDIGDIELTEQLHLQIGTLVDVSRDEGATVRFVKMHGALYNEMSRDPALARTVARAVFALDRDLVLLAQAGTCAVTQGRLAGLEVAAEAFADRAYLPDGSLAPRRLIGAVIEDRDEVARRAVDIAVHGLVRCADGTELPIQADSICVHGDTSGAFDSARAARRALLGAGITLAPFTS